MDMEALVPVADTGFVVALLNRTDAQHRVVSTLYRESTRPIHLPQTVLAEVAYLVGHTVGVAMVVNFLHGLPRSRFQLIALTDQNIARIAQILAQYADSRIDFVDASVMAIAESTRSTLIYTLDQRDFRLFRPTHSNHLTLLP